MRVGDKVYEPCGHTSHYTSFPPRPAKEGEVFKEDLERQVKALKKDNEWILYWLFVIGIPVLYFVLFRAFWR